VLKYTCDGVLTLFSFLYHLMQKRRQTPICSFRFHFIMEKNQSVLKLYSNNIDNLHKINQQIGTIIHYGTYPSLNTKLADAIAGLMASCYVKIKQRRHAIDSHDFRTFKHEPSIFPLPWPLISPSLLTWYKILSTLLRDHARTSNLQLIVRHTWHRCEEVSGVPKIFPFKKIYKSQSR